MSLLMDALKKAEQDKKEAARRQMEAESPSQHESAQKLENSGRHEVDNTSIETPDSTKEAVENTGRFSTTADLALEPITAENKASGIPGTDNAASPGSEDQTLNVTMNTLSLAELPGASVEIDEADTLDLVDSSIAELQTEDSGQLDETFHGVSLADNPELFQETMQGEAFFPEDDASRTYGETLTDIPAIQLTRDIGAEDQPTPVAAQTVFAATRTRESSGNGFKWVLGGLCATAFVAVTIWYYYFATPPQIKSLSPQVAQGIESVVSPLNQTLNIDATSLSGTLAGDLESLVSEEDKLVAETLGNGTEISQTTENSEQLLTEEAMIGELAEDAGDVDTAVISTESEVAVNQAQFAEDEISEQEKVIGLPDKIIPEPSLIKISRSKEQEDKGQILREAYSAYQNGDYQDAKSKYQEALKEFPDNRDALLGLGAIASNKGDYKEAYLWYAQLLSVNPADKLAKVGLINLQNKSGLLNSESTVNSMLHENPNTHVLHFTLGNIYAASNRWAAAQQAFFDAYRLNSSSSDYALNLAISLDHIGQRESALDYYAAALELSDSTNLNFDFSQVQKRINDLSNIVKP